MPGADADKELQWGYIAFQDGLLYGTATKRVDKAAEMARRGLADSREIAQRLGLSQHTIKNYLFRVYDKLGVSSRLELLFMTLSHAGAPSMTGAASPSRADQKRRGRARKGKSAPSAPSVRAAGGRAGARRRPPGRASRRNRKVRAALRRT